MNLQTLSGNVEQNNEECQSKPVGEFKRIEDKFIVSQAARVSVLSKISLHMRPSYPEKNTQFTVIESIYFDSKNLDFFKHDVADFPTQYKLRIRQYAPNGISNSKLPALLELKRKKGRESKKLRFKIGPMQILGLYKGESLPLNTDLIDLNKEIPADILKSRLTIINDLMGEFLLRPVSSISYKRLAFEEGDLRVTIDTDLQEKRLVDVFNRNEFQVFSRLDKTEKMIKKFSAKDCFILEVKHQGNIPLWLEEILSDQFLNKSSFSKYAYFTAKALEINQKDK